MRFGILPNGPPWLAVREPCARWMGLARLRGQPFVVCVEGAGAEMSSMQVTRHVGLVEEAAESITSVDVEVRDLVWVGEAVSGSGSSGLAFEMPRWVFGRPHFTIVRPPTSTR